MHIRKNQKFIVAFLMFLALGTEVALVEAVPSKKTITVTREVISNPTNKTVSSFIKAMKREYKKANRKKEYDEAADYLRAGLYFLQQDKKSPDYAYFNEKLVSVLDKCQADVSNENSLEIAKNLYLENKLFASAYEFSKLLNDKYEVDVCYEYLGDIARKMDTENVAFEFYKKALESNPENVNAKYKYANLLLKNGKLNDAIYYFEEVIEETNLDNVVNEIISTFIKALEKYPENENIYGVLGLAYQKLGQYDKTYQLLKKSLLINPNDIFLRYYLGNLLFNIEEFEFADEIYSEILEENPYESQIRISRAKTYIKINQLEHAIKDFQIVLAMYPDSLQAQYGMYALLKQRLPLEKIINLFYPLEPDYKLDDEGYNNLGYFANKLGNSKDAVVFFEKSLSLNSKSEIPYIELYKAYQLLNMNNNAKDILQKAFKLFPNNAEIIEMYQALNSDKINEKNNVALSYLNEGEYQKAITVYEQIEPKNAETYSAIANCYRQLGDFKNAIVNYKKALKITPDDSENYYALGVAYLESNNLKQAKESFTTSLEKNSKNIKSKKMLAYLEQKEIIKNLDLAYDFYEKKDYMGALRYLDKAVLTFPNDPKVYYYRGLTREAMQNYKGAVFDFRQTIEVDRNYIVAYFKLAENLEKINKKKEALYMYEKYLGAENLDKELMKKAEQKVIELGEQYY